MPRRRTALVIVVPEAERWVAKARLAHDSSAALGVPAHITILFPFLPAEEIDEATLEELVAMHPAFPFELMSVVHFGDEVTYLAPVPAEPFVELTRAVAARWPEFPPYEGAHEEVTPHLTVGECRLELEVPLPISCFASDVTLLQEETPSGRWRERRRASR